MSVALIDGVLGLEATWGFNGVTMNDLEGGLPMIALSQIDCPTGDFAEVSTPAGGRYGEIPRSGWLAGVSRTFTGTVMADDLQGMRQLAAALKTAASIPVDTTLVATPHPDWGTIAWTMFGRPIALDPPEIQSTSAQACPQYQRGFTLTFRQRDPRAFALASGVTVGDADDTAATITPGGRAPTEPTWTIAGPAGDTLDLVNVTTGRKVRFAGLPLLSGHDLLVGFGGLTPRRYATIDGVDMTGYIDWSETDWWRSDTYGLSAGANSIKAMGAGAWSVTAYPAVFG